VQSARLIDGVIRPSLVVVGEMVLLIGIFSVVFLTSPILGLAVIVACGGAIGLYYLVFRRRALAWGHQRLEGASLLHEIVSNTVSGVTEIKIFGKEAYMTDRVTAAARAETAMFEKLEMYQQAPRFILESVFVLAFLSVFAAFLWLGIDLTVLLAKFSVIVAAMFRLLPCMNRLVNSYSNFSFNLGPASLLLEEIDRLPDVAPTAAPPPPPGRDFTAASVELRDIHFHHRAATDRPILRGVNLTIPRGQRLGIAGASGSGKSTLVEILAALHAPTQGVVLVDGIDIATDTAGWQLAVGYVPQVAFILPGTIRENVSFRPDTSHDDSAVWAALEQVGFAPFVRGLAAGLDTRIGEKNMGLSGGQRQLICLARALFRQPKILLLDEPTAALDPASEAVVLAAVDRLPRETTVVMISHKPENFRHFDVIFHCEHGRLQPVPLPSAAR
jgi:ATP-binding cassette, subfamily B, bacterial PglK